MNTAKRAPRSADMDPGAVAGLVQAAILKAERSQAWTATKADIALSTFRRKLAGDGEFTVPELYRIAVALGVAPSSLLPRVFGVRAKSGRAA